MSEEDLDKINFKTRSSSYRRLTFDIETAPDFERVELLMKPFDPDSVKIGNIKDEFLKKEKINAARKAHSDKAFDSAALHPETARVCAIGYHDSSMILGEGIFVINADEDGEAEALKRFWSYTGEILNAQNEMVGFNIKNFDLPFLIRRSYHLGVEPSPFLLNPRNRRWHSGVVDLMEFYGSGEWGYRISLDKVCKSLDIGGKADQKGDISGKEFWRWWRGMAPSKKLPPSEQKKLALSYLQNDIGMTKRLADRLLGLARLPEDFNQKPEDDQEVSLKDSFDLEKPFITLYKQKEKEGET